MDRAELARLLGPTCTVQENSAEIHVIEESNPKAFIKAFSHAIRGAGPLFLIDPNWGPSERKGLAGILASAENRISDTSRGWLMIASGGTSGKLKFVRHDEQTLAVAVRGFCKHFEVKRVNWVGVLPMYHVSGFVAWCRTAITGGTYLPWDWKEIEAGYLPKLNRAVDAAQEGWYLSLVPTQLQRIFSSPHAETIIAWLRLFDGVFIGGGPIWPALATQAAELKLPLCLSYGMTETAAMVTALRPKEFLQGRRDSGSALPHASICLNAQGLIEIDARSVFLGYYPEINLDQHFVTEDLGELDSEGNLTILGRRDAVIITGGKKVDPLEVEAVLRASGVFEDVAVLGVTDLEWGQRIVALYPKPITELDQLKLDKHLLTLASFKRPKQYIPIENWPRNAQGKLNRAELGKRIASA